MKRSDENAAEASLELLLDTICNSFGGILFLTILMALLLKISAPKFQVNDVSSAAQHELIERETAFHEALAQRDSLNKALEFQGETTSQLVSPSFASEMREVEQSQRQVSELRQKIVEKTQALTELQKQAEELAGKIAAEATVSQAIDSEIAKAKDDLARNIENRTRSLNPSIIRRTSKIEVALVVRYGRLYSVNQADKKSLLPSFNSEDFVPMGTDEARVSYTPKPYRGLSLAGQAETRLAVKKSLAAYPSDSHYVALAIWEDSFESTSLLRNALTELGYECRLIPASKDSILSFGRSLRVPEVQ